MLNETDLQILLSVQRNASLTSQELAESLGLSPSQAHRRRQKLESEGIIASVTAHLNPQSIGLNIQAFLSVSTEFNSEKDTDSFSQFMSSLPQVVGAWSLTGDSNYLLRTFCRDLPELKHLTHHILPKHKCVKRVQCSIVLDQTKLDSPLPIPLD